MVAKVPQESKIPKIPKITVTDSDCNNESARPKGIVQTRYIFTIMMFLGMVIGVANDLALSIVIVGMVDQCEQSK